MSKKKKLDYKKEFPLYYRPSSKKPVILEIPEMNFFMIDGKGDPNTSQEFEDATEVLYGVSFTLKMKIVKKQNPDNDYTIPPLEGLWYIDNMEEWNMKKKDKWKWKLMIRIPDFVTESQITKAITILKETKNPVALPKLRFEKYNEGTVVQIMYIGPYDAEGPTIASMHQFARDNEYKLNGKHHEIYLGDPRRTKPEKLKTILRQPVVKV